MADDFDGEILTNEKADGFYGPEVHGYTDSVRFEREVKEAVYLAEIAEIEKLTDALRAGRLKQTDLSPKARTKGLAILKARLARLKAKYGGPLPNPKPKPKAKAKAWLPARIAAKKAGLSKYEPGRPCRNGHNSPRYVANNICVACMAESKAKRQALHPGEIKEYRRKWWAKNKEKYKAN